MRGPITYVKLIKLTKNALLPLELKNLHRLQIDANTWFTLTLI